jgi:hypothetical protein
MLSLSAFGTFWCHELAQRDTIVLDMGHCYTLWLAGMLKYFLVSALHFYNIANCQTFTEFIPFKSGSGNRDDAQPLYYQDGSTLPQGNKSSSSCLTRQAISTIARHCLLPLTHWLLFPFRAPPTLETALISPGPSISSVVLLATKARFGWMRKGMKLYITIARSLTAAWDWRKSSSSGQMDSRTLCVLGTR